VRGQFNVIGEVLTGVVTFHVGSALPQFAFADIINLAVIRNINRLSVTAVKFRQYVSIEFLHLQKLPGFWAQKVKTVIDRMFFTGCRNDIWIYTTIPEALE
jgi:hypothetical protein